MKHEMLANIKKLTITIHDDLLFENCSFSIHRGVLQVLIGGNGCGKSTLLEYLYSQGSSKLLNLNDTVFDINGSISFPSGVSISYLPQVPRDVMDIIPMIKSEMNLNPGILQGMYTSFGIDYEPADSDAFYDGEFPKLAIIRTILSDVDIYIFDEPTNYLDITGIIALEEHLHRLKQNGKAILMVTHDRALADNLADQTILLTPHVVYSTVGGASQALSIRISDRESRRRQASDIGKKIAQLQKDARSKAGWSAKSESKKKGAGSSKPYFAKLSARMAKRAKAVMHRAEKEQEKLQKVKPFVPKELNLHFPEYQVRNREMFRLEKMSFGYDQSKEILLSKIDLASSTTDRICLMGANGTGKTTIVKIIRNKFDPSNGIRYINRNVKTAYVPQGLTDFFRADSLLDNFNDTGFDQTTIRQYLGAAFLRKNKVENSIDTFSRGELMRAAIVKCILSRAEFLFLDEPTTHLDIESIEVLEHLLQEFQGGFLLISHDRAFVSNVSDKLYMLENGHVKLV